VISPIDPTLATDLAGLTPDQLGEVAVYARRLRAKNGASSPERSGTPGAELLRFAGVLSNDEASQMMPDIVEEGYSQTTTPLSTTVIEAISSLTEAQQLELISLAKKVKPVLTREERIAGWEKLRGTLSKEDAEEMMAIIEEGCGQINHAAW
jgi:hypothetical protein